MKTSLLPVHWWIYANSDALRQYTNLLGQPVLRWHAGRLGRSKWCRRGFVGTAVEVTKFESIMRILLKILQPQRNCGGTRGKCRGSWHAILKSVNWEIYENFPTPVHWKFYAPIESEINQNSDVYETHSSDSVQVANRPRQGDVSYDFHDENLRLLRESDAEPLAARRAAEGNLNRDPTPGTSGTSQQRKRARTDSDSNSGRNIRN